MSTHTPTPQDHRFFKTLLVIAALLGGSGVTLGALAAHLPARAFAIPGGRDVLHSAVEITMWHVLALFALGLGRAHLARQWVRITSATMLAGLMLFSASVTLYVFTNLSLFSISIAHVAPWGGTLLILSWIMAAIAVARA